MQPLVEGILAVATASYCTQEFAESILGAMELVLQEDVLGSLKSTVARCSAVEKLLPQALAIVLMTFPEQNRDVGAGFSSINQSETSWRKGLADSLHFGVVQWSSC